MANLNTVYNSTLRSEVAINSIKSDMRRLEEKLDNLAFMLQKISDEQTSANNDTSIKQSSANNATSTEQSSANNATSTEQSNANNTTSTQQSSANNATGIEQSHKIQKKK